MDVVVAVAVVLAVSSSSSSNNTSIQSFQFTCMTTQIPVSGSIEEKQEVLGRTNRLLFFRCSFNI
jgi:hypothetical protein